MDKGEFAHLIRIRKDAAKRNRKQQNVRQGVQVCRALVRWNLNALTHKSLVVFVLVTPTYCPLDKGQMTRVEGTCVAWVGTVVKGDSITVVTSPVASSSSKSTIIIVQQNENSILAMEINRLPTTGTVMIERTYPPQPPQDRFVAAQRGVPTVYSTYTAQYDHP